MVEGNVQIGFVQRQRFDEVGMPSENAVYLWGGVYFCTEWVEEKKRRKSLWGVGLSKAGAGKNLHQLLLWFDKKCVIFCTEMYGK